MIGQFAHLGRGKVLGRDLVVHEAEGGEGAEEDR
jgi:hypothetical protein